ncbi:unnamed protein product [Paramecium pentaurelia]|uniref:Uncharacterized protein n=1 Tax=Paramecium pentaurelia TaxID=43138 RepID=A0A8S1T170_9CILI|nr:unnamed protein product [Paramecium pentaurelia]
MNYKKKPQKFCSIKKNIKKSIRGAYKKISAEKKREILSTLMHSRDSLSQISQQFNVNKETIRSFYKKLNHKNLYLDLELYLVSKHLNLEESQDGKIEKNQISKQLKQDIDNYQLDEKLEKILKEIQSKREQSKSKKKKPVIQFTSKNRRIINKIVSFIILAGAAAAKNNTEFINDIKTKIIEEFYDAFFFQYLDYDPVFSNIIYTSISPLNFEYESSQFSQSQQTETRPYFP